MSIHPEFFPSDGLPLFTQEDEDAMIDARAPLLLTNEDVRHCERVVQVGLFFDGTNNNMERDLPGKGHTNIVRLFNAYPDRREMFQYPYYVPGVGTKCVEVGDTDPESLTVKTLGRAFAKGGWYRVLLGCVHLLNSIHAVLMGEPLLKGDAAIAAKVTAARFEPPSWNPADLRQVLQAQFADELQRLKHIVKNKPKPSIRVVSLSIFGFSRGAAQARAFANVLQHLCDAPGGRTIAGIRLQLQFMGMFDTVYSVGLPLYSAMKDNFRWARPDLTATPAGVKAVHFVAGHEQRHAFPLDLMPGAAIEHVYPGVHSDVGGGYNPREEGRSIDRDARDMLARIACMNMHRQARRAGVPLYALSEMPPGTPQNDFAPIPAPLVAAFNDYLRLSGVGANKDTSPPDIYAAMRQHCERSLRWRGSVRRNLPEQRFYADAPDQDRQDLWDANVELNEDLKTDLQSDPDYEAAREQVLHGPLDEAERAVCDALFGRYVHDSLAGFMILGTDRSDMARHHIEARAALDARVAGLGTMRERMQLLRNTPPPPVAVSYQAHPEGEYNTWLKRRELLSSYLQYRGVYPLREVDAQRERAAREALSQRRKKLVTQRLEAEAFARTQVRR